MSHRNPYFVATDDRRLLIYGGTFEDQYVEGGFVVDTQTLSTNELVADQEVKF